MNQAPEPIPTPNAGGDRNNGWRRRSGAVTPRRTKLKLATLAWVQWWNQRRLHGALDHIPPAEHEARYYREHQQSKEVV